MSNEREPLGIIPLFGWFFLGLVGFLSLGSGGILKGATGAGAPIIAVLDLAILFDVPTAMPIFSLPNLFANISQAWTFRREQRSKQRAKI